MIPYPTLKFGHPEEIEAMREEVYKFAQKELVPRAAEIDHKNEFPQDMWRKLGGMGLLGMTVSEEYGGADMGYLAADVGPPGDSEREFDAGGGEDLCQIQRGDGMGGFGGGDEHFGATGCGDISSEVDVGRLYRLGVGGADVDGGRDDHV